MAANYTKYDDDVVMNQSWHYSKCYDVWEVRPELTEILERHGDDKYHIFRKIIQFKNYLLLSEEKKSHSQNTKSLRSDVIRRFK